MRHLDTKQYKRLLGRHNSEQKRLQDIMAVCFTVRHKQFRLRNSRNTVIAGTRACMCFDRCAMICQTAVCKSSAGLNLFCQSPPVIARRPSHGTDLFQMEDLFLFFWTGQPIVWTQLHAWLNKNGFHCRNALECNCYITNGTKNALITMTGISLKIH